MTWGCSALCASPPVALETNPWCSPYLHSAQLPPACAASMAQGEESPALQDMATPAWGKRPGQPGFLP